MTFELGKSTIKTITGTVTIMEPGDDGKKKPVSKLKVTTRILPRSEFLDLCAQNDDCHICKTLVEKIEAGDSTTTVAEYTPALMDEIFEHEWQFNPIFEFVMRTNNERMGRALQLKN